MVEINNQDLIAARLTDSQLKELQELEDKINGARGPADKIYLLAMTRKT